MEFLKNLFAGTPLEPFIKFLMSLLGGTEQTHAENPPPSETETQSSPTPSEPTSSTTDMDFDAIWKTVEDVLGGNVSTGNSDAQNAENQPIPPDDAVELPADNEPLSPVELPADNEPLSPIEPSVENQPLASVESPAVLPAATPSNTPTSEPNPTEIAVEDASLGFAEEPAELTSVQANPTPPTEPTPTFQERESLGLADEPVVAAPSILPEKDSLGFEPE